MKISVITASYNYASYIEQTINSVINQSYQDWELIIVDDGSSDNSVEIIKSYCQKDERIKFFQHENGENKGLKETLLLGIEHASGEWVAFLESDDYFAPDNLLKKAEIIKKYPKVKLIFNKVNFLCEEESLQVLTKPFKESQAKLSNMKFPRSMLKEFYIGNVILTFSCVMVEKNTLKNADFNTPVDSLLDWWLWVNLSYANQFYYIEEELTNWRLHAHSYIKKQKKPILYTVQVQAYQNVYKQHKNDLGLLCFILYSSIILFGIRLWSFCRRKFVNPSLRIINRFINIGSGKSGNKP